MEIPAQVFICYAREDVASARRLAAELEVLGAQPWFDEISIGVGERWRSKIRDAITASTYFIALLSSHSVSKRGFVQRELLHALDLLDSCPPGTVFLIPVRLDDCEPTHEKLREMQRADLFPSWKDGLMRVASALGLAERAKAKPTISVDGPLDAMISVKKGFMGYLAELLFYYEVPKPLRLSASRYARLLKDTANSVTNAIPYFDIHPERQHVLVESLKTSLPSFVGFPGAKVLERQSTAEVWTGGVYISRLIDVIVTDRRRDQRVFTTASTSLHSTRSRYSSVFTSLTFSVGDGELEFEDVTTRMWRSKRFAVMDAGVKIMLRKVLPVWYAEFAGRNLIVESKLDENYYDPDILGCWPKILYCWWVDDGR